MPAADEPHRLAVPGAKPTPEWLEKNLKGVKVSEGREVAVLKAAKSAGAQVIWALAGLALCGAAGYTLINKGPPTVSVDVPNRWSSIDQQRFESTLSSRLDKMDRVIERMDLLLVAQSKTTERILGMMERQEERIKRLEEARK